MENLTGLWKGNGKVFASAVVKRADIERILEMVTGDKLKFLLFVNNRKVAGSKHPDYNLLIDKDTPREGDVPKEEF